MIRFAFVAEKNRGSVPISCRNSILSAAFFPLLQFFCRLRRLWYIPRIPLESPNFSPPKPTKSNGEDSVRYIDRAGKKIDLFLVPPLPLHLPNYIKIIQFVANRGAFLLHFPFSRPLLRGPPHALPREPPPPPLFQRGPGPALPPRPGDAGGLVPGHSGGRPGRRRGRKPDVIIIHVKKWPVCGKNGILGPRAGYGTKKATCSHR